MPLDPLQYSDSVVRVYERCVDELLVNLAKHFNVSATGNTASWNYEIMMLSKLGAVRRESAAIIAKMVSAGEPAIEEAVRAAMIEAIQENEPDLKKAALNGLLNDVQMDAIDGIQSRLQAFSRQAKSQLNLVNTTMLESTADAFRQGVAAANDIIKQMDAAQDVLNVQTGMVHLGTKTHQEALRAAVKAMSDAGITGFIDRAGRKWSAEAYVRMNVQTTCGRAANQAVMDRNASYGNDIVWPRTNATARPGCYPWQGQLISMSNVPRDVQDGKGESRHVYAASETTYGQPAGIWGINCHHFPMNVFIPNFSYVRGEENKPPQAENDRLYQLTQEQRRLERRVRYAKRDAAMYKAAGDEKAFQRCALRVETAANELREYVAANPSLVLDSSRTWVYGYNRSVSASAAAANRKTHAAQAAKAAKQAAKATKAHNLDECKTVADVENLMRGKKWFRVDTYGSTTVDRNERINLSKADLESSKAIYTAYDQVFTKYPELVGRFSNPHVDALGDNTIANCSHDGFITHSTKYYSDFSVLKATNDRIVKRGFSPAGTDEAAITTHELAHAIEVYLGEKLLGKKDWGYARGMKQRVLKACGIRANEIMHEVSGYATTSTSEFFAECFAEYMRSPNPRPVAAEFGRQFEKAMEEARRK